VSLVMMHVAQWDESLGHPHAVLCVDIGTRVLQKTAVPPLVLTVLTACSSIADVVANCASI
jgi:hypothetical protein